MVQITRRFSLNFANISIYIYSLLIWELMPQPLVFKCRAAIVWATWDLIALVENEKRDGPPTHAVTFVWNNGREVRDLLLTT